MSAEPSISAAQFRQMNKPGARSKYRNKKTVRDGKTFDSKREADHYTLLMDMLDKDEIENLELQPGYSLHVNGHYIARCRFDFRFFDKKQAKTRVQDVKGYQNPKDPVTRLFNRNCKHVEAEYGVKVEVIK